MSESKLHVDAILVAATHMIELQEERTKDLHVMTKQGKTIEELRSVIARLSGERDQLQTKLDEHELLFGHALHTDDFLQKLLNGLAHQLPENTPRTVDGIVDVVANMALRLDAHEDASTPAFDEIAKLCGCPQWDYPAQLVRDVENVVKERDKLRKEKAEWDEHYEAMRACIVYARDRRGKSFVFEDWETMVEYALRGGITPPCALEDAQAKEAQAWEAVTKIREERDFWKGQANALTPAHVALQDKLRIAESVRDDARAASQRYLDEKRHLEEDYQDLRADRAGLANQVKFLSDDQVRLVEEREGHRHRKDAVYAERDRCVAGLAALAVRLGWSAWLGKHVGEPWDADWRTIVFINLPFGQVSWHVHDSEVEWFSFLPEIPERTWDGHTTEQKYERLAQLGRGGINPYEEQPAEPCRDHTFVGDACRDCGAPVTEFSSMLSTTEPKLEDFIARCGCSPKYVELAPGVHAKYCPLAGLPLEVSNG